ncbi:HP0495 family protein [Helicobacter heilmannii]|uniref:Uncharacterized protein n=1 Tax=Helicobacter heilmannii TaxID=35817 RepID=A0A0K2YC39_HELHE|nr:DUF493 domain-containing protein [Helicobacter heilmannii]BDQ26643.1 hypothetical protein ASB1_03190 [Helicobacter heilmannii]GMB94752.1 hypothetical protein NHP21011_08450 [Helicobacter heilmannii]CCM11036.1 hypothetical protein BN341_11130 [Helicobacter heilmannii ASB1.4]CRI34550.1 hypothetical protein HHE01_03510 [Helicobacter heilmannii]
MDYKNTINYPCLWEYCVITDKPQEFLDTLPELLAPLKYQVCPKHKSAQGTYTSLQLSLVVASEQEQHALFEKLSNHAFVKWVL